MIANLTINISQIKFYVQSARSVFDTLCTEDAIEIAKCNLDELLIYLDRLNGTDNTISILFADSSKPRIIIEGIVGDSKL